MTYPNTATEEGRAQRIKEIISDHARRSKHKGDYHFRMAESWGVDGDYLPGYDDGEGPAGAYEFSD